MKFPTGSPLVTTTAMLVVVRSLTLSPAVLAEELSRFSTLLSAAQRADTSWLTLAEMKAALGHSRILRGRLRTALRIPIETLEAGKRLVG